MSNELQLRELAKSLKLYGILDTLESRLQQAKESSMSYEELLARLFQDELATLEQHALQRRIDVAKFEEVKTFINFDMNRYSLQIRHAINDLMTGRFIKERNHIIIMGPVGTGKTHLSQALGMLACQKNKKVKFVVTNELLNEFYRARADEMHDKLFKRYAKFDLLILDDFASNHYLQSNLLIYMT